MSTTFGELKTRVSTVLQDPDQRTFTEGLVEELVHEALVEVGRIAPEQFQEDLTPVANQMTYQLRSNEFGVTQYDMTGEADTDLFTSAAHGLSEGDAVRFASLSGGTGLSTTTTYFVIASGLTTDDFKVSTSLGGSAVNFTTDVTAGTWSHYGSGQAVPEIEVSRVEIWNGDEEPMRFIQSVISAPQQPGAGFGDRGWYVWAGELYLPTRTVLALAGYEDTYLIRVWGYSPYNPPERDADVIAVSKEVEQAMLWYIRVAALEMLLASRDLFTQWQTRSGNTDMSPAGLMNQKSIAEAAWSRRSKAITRLRSEY